MIDIALLEVYSINTHLNALLALDDVDCKLVCNFFDGKVMVKYT